MRRVPHAQRSSRTLYDHRISVLTDHLRGNRFKARRQFVGLVQLFDEHSITLVYLHLPVFLLNASNKYDFQNSSIESLHLTITLWPIRDAFMVNDSEVTQEFTKLS